jgi:putative solute:sodium symporter small subunit
VDSLQTENHRRYWRKNRAVIAALLVVWFGVTFGVSFFARELSFNFFGWPFSFWIGAQGSLLVYGSIIGFYAWYMNRLDSEHGVQEEAD